MENNDIKIKVKEFEKKIKAKCEVISAFSNQDILKIKKILVKYVN